MKTLFIYSLIQTFYKSEKEVDYILNIHFSLFGSVWLKGDKIWPGFFPGIKSHSLRKSRLTHCLETLMLCTIHQTMWGNCMPITFFFFNFLLTYNIPTEKCAYHKRMKVKVKLLSRIRLFATPRTVAYQAPLSMGFPRQEH